VCVCVCVSHCGNEMWLPRWCEINERERVRMERWFSFMILVCFLFTMDVLCRCPVDVGWGWLAEWPDPHKSCFFFCAYVFMIVWSFGARRSGVSIPNKEKERKKSFHSLHMRARTHTQTFTHTHTHTHTQRQSNIQILGEWKHDLLSEARKSLYEVVR